MTANLRRKWFPFQRILLKSTYLSNFCSIWNIPRKSENYWQLQSLNGATKRGAYLALLFHEKPSDAIGWHTVCHFTMATLYRKLKVKHTRGKDRFPQRDDLPISNNDYRQ
ncbi:hypothetical protein T4B_13808 [Trichinella pseudospiralis]|uniref:Uncharacterized protein n=1 Tax=Trichinella pseudospiralis TaxID=6337 RepID=A0A0V1GLJ4_TRIPS|nr:hypothetical protein T4B_13808 [Trichinella pseudospiralis]